jgi:hypothetical protein
LLDTSGFVHYSSSSPSLARKEYLKLREDFPYLTATAATRTGLDNTLTPVAADDEEETFRIIQGFAYTRRVSQAIYCVCVHKTESM